MQSYEAMFIFHPGLSEEEQKALVAELENILKENKAEVSSSQVFGRRHLAYEINKHQEGLYYLINFSTQDLAVIPKLKKTCNINENVLRLLVVKKRPKEVKHG